MKNTMFQDTFGQVSAREHSTEHLNNFGPGGSDLKFHAFAAHLFRKWMHYDPKNRAHYFHYVLSNLKEAECQDMSL